MKEDYEGPLGKVGFGFSYIQIDGDSDDTVTM
jgi:hypothetical protein